MTPSEFSRVLPLWLLQGTQIDVLRWSRATARLYWRAREGDRTVWTTGGCWLLAAGLRTWIGRKAKLGAFVSASTQWPPGAVAEAFHVYCAVGPACIDGAGVHPAEALLARWTALCRKHEPQLDTHALVPFDEVLRESLIPQPSSSQRAKLAHLLLADFGPSPWSGHA